MSIEPEAQRKSYEGDVAAVGMNGDEDILQVEARRIAERQLVRKLDVRLLPTIIVIFLMNFIDVRRVCGVTCTHRIEPCLISQRVAVTAARLKGLQTDLGLSSTSSLVWGGLVTHQDNRRSV